MKYEIRNTKIYRINIRNKNNTQLLISYSIIIIYTSPQEIEIIQFTMSQDQGQSQKQTKNNIQKDNTQNKLIEKQTKQLFNQINSCQQISPTIATQKQLTNFSTNDQYQQQIHGGQYDRPYYQSYPSLQQNNTWTNQGFYPQGFSYTPGYGYPNVCHQPYSFPTHPPMYQPMNHGFCPPPYYFQNQGRFSQHHNFGFNPFPMQMQMQKNGQKYENKRHTFGGFRSRRGRCHNFREKTHNRQSSDSQSPQKTKKFQQKQRDHDSKKQQNEKIAIQNDEQTQSDQQKLSLEKKMENMSIKTCQQQQNEINQKKIEFQSWLDPFFKQYKASANTIHRTLTYLAKRYSHLEQLTSLISILYQLKLQKEQYFNSEYFSFYVIVKNIIKKDYKIEEIKNVLNKKMTIKKKKFNSALRFQQKFPNPAQIQFLEQQELSELDIKKTLFLVDGNNIFPKQKIFRKYFQSVSESERAQGQVRLAWLFSQTQTTCQLFFDNKYSDELLRNIKQSILSQSEQEAVNKIKIHYADKHISAQNTADMKLIERLLQIVSQKEYKQHQIVIVSADKQLLQLCSEAKPDIKQTSGKYIFKYCKELIKKRYYNIKSKKSIIKDIFVY